MPNLIGKRFVFRRRRGGKRGHGHERSSTGAFSTPHASPGDHRRDCQCPRSRSQKSGEKSGLGLPENSRGRITPAICRFPLADLAALVPCPAQNCFLFSRKESNFFGARFCSFQPRCRNVGHNHDGQRRIHMKRRTFMQSFAAGAVTLSRFQAADRSWRGDRGRAGNGVPPTARRRPLPKRGGIG